ncbi:MAG: hypothetical protein NTV52_11570 [Acidobacteria bacterium]|nr:hypothetical protein [Acidobacteriota bacterium]
MTSLEAAFQDLTAILTEMELEYAVGGSFASSTFGVPRSTLDVDLVVSLSPEEAYHLARLATPHLVCDPEEARAAVAANRSFNLLHMRHVYKFNIFPTTFFAHGEDEVRRRVMVEGTPLAGTAAVPMVSAEDILLAKLAWFRNGGETSERQWSDMTGIWRMQGAALDQAYLEAWAKAMGNQDLLGRLREEGEGA